MELFLDNDAHELTKESGFASRLSENPDSWPQELTSELYKQLPYLSDYEMSVNLDRVEPQRGFAFGYADLSNRTERPEVEHEEAGLPHVRIPIVVMERGVKPFSIFLDGERVVPLTEERIREVLFNPSTFDLSTSAPRDPSLVEATMPPSRSGIGMGGETKLGSVGSFIQGKVNKSAEEAVKHVGKKYGKQLAGAAAGVTALSGAAGYAGGKAGAKSKEKTAAMQTVQKYYGNDGMGGETKLASADARHEYEQLQADPSYQAIVRKIQMNGGLQKGFGSLSKDEQHKFSTHTVVLSDLRKEFEGKDKTAAMQTVQKYYGNGGVGDIVDQWMAEFTRLNSLPIDSLEKTAFVKEGFHHISKPQWEAIQKSDKVQKMVQKYGTPSHPAVTNAMYDTASKVFGFHPKVYNTPQSMQKGIQGGLRQPGQGKAPTPPKQAQPKAPAKAKTASLLEAIAPTISQADRDAFVEKVASSPSIRSGLSRAGITERLVTVFDETKTASASEMLQTLAEGIEPTVVTVQKLPGGDFLVKSANVNAFAGDEAAMGQVVPGEEAAEALGPDTAQSMQPGQTATAVEEPVEGPDQPLFNPANQKVVDEFGEWLVQDSMGNSMMGWVFPQTLAWDGDFTPQPIALFTNGAAYSLQEAVAGELIGKGTTFPSDTPRGDGVFYATEGGKAICTAPITIGSATGGPDGTQTFLGQDLFGNQVQVHLVEGIDKPTRVSDVEYAMPKSWKFMRLNNQTQLVPDPVQMNKTAAARALQSSAVLFYNGSYNLEGGCGLHKLARDMRYDLDPVSAEFMLGVLGVEGRLAKQKVAEARKKGSVKLAGLKTITLLSERYQEATKTAAALIAQLPNLRRDLVKEAAELEDEATVDSLLSLNFISPENIATFVSYLPELEGTAEKLAEMLLTCYLGLQELPEGALERGMKNLEEVISGLKAMQHADA